MSQHQSIIKAPDGDEGIQKINMSSTPPCIPHPYLQFSKTTSYPSFQVLPSRPQTPVPIPVSSSNMTSPSPFQNLTASILSIPPMLARPPRFSSKIPAMGERPRPILIVPRALSAPFPISAQGMRVPNTPFPQPQLPGVTPVGLPGVSPVGPLGGSFVNSTASGNQSAVSYVTDTILPPRAGPPAVEQLDAWTAYKTESGPVFYYNAATGISTSEKPAGYKGELSMSVQECYLCLISRLPTSVTTEQVREIFSKFGRILDAKVLLNNFTDVPMGYAYIIFESRTARSAAMGCSGMFMGRNMLLVTDASVGFGVNAYEVEDGMFNACITIGESRKRRPMESDCGGSQATEMLVTGDHEGIIQEALL